MKTKTLAILTVIFSLAISAKGQEINLNNEARTLSRGYRGFIELESLCYEFSLSEISVITISTTHGYQFNPHLFAGIGIGYYGTMDGWGSVFHADVRYDFLEGKHSPYADLKVNKDHDIVLRPSVGYRFKHFNVSLGYWYPKDKSCTKYYTLSLGFDFGGRKK